MQSAEPRETRRGGAATTGSTTKHTKYTKPGTEALWEKPLKRERIFTRHLGGMVDNSPTFQHWVLEFSGVQVPKGRLKRRIQPAVPSGLVLRQALVPKVETSGTKA